jgi:hypothetical protein
MAGRGRVVGVVGVRVRGLGFLLFIGALLYVYALLLVAVTPRRWSVPGPVLAAGAVCGAVVALCAYAMTPFGSAWHPLNWSVTALIYLTVLIGPLCAFVALGRYARRIVVTAARGPFGPPRSLRLPRRRRGAGKPLATTDGCYADLSGVRSLRGIGTTAETWLAYS